MKRKHRIITKPDLEECRRVSRYLSSVESSRVALLSLLHIWYIYTCDSRAKEDSRETQRVVLCTCMGIERNERTKGKERKQIVSLLSSLSRGYSVCARIRGKRIYVFVDKLSVHRVYLSIREHWTLCHRPVGRFRTVIGAFQWKLSNERSHRRLLQSSIIVVNLDYPFNGVR